MNNVYRKYPGTTYKDYYHREVERYRLLGFELVDFDVDTENEEDMLKALQMLRKMKKTGRQEYKKAV